MTRDRLPSHAHRAAARGPGPGRPPDDPARFWDRTARRYAADPIADAAGFENSLRRTAALLSPSQDVLEVGCGTGTVALRLAAGTRRYLATDVSPEMIAIAREKLAAQPVAPLRFDVASLEGLAAPKASCDTVLAFNLLHLVRDLDAALDNIRQALRPGGLFISKTSCVAEMNPLIPRVAIPVMRWLGKAPYVHAFDAVDLQAAMTRRGFRIEAAERHGTMRRDTRIYIVARRP